MQKAKEMGQGRPSRRKVRIAKSKQNIVSKVGKAPGDTDTPSFDITGLEEGKDYLFRIKAVNDEGESEALEADTAIVAKNPYGELLFNQVRINMNLHVISSIL